MKIISIISVHKPPYNKQWPLERGYKRVEAIVEERGWRTTRHLDIKKDTEEAKEVIEAERTEEADMAERALHESVKLAS